MIDLAPTLLHIAGLEDQALEVILSSSDLTAVIVSFLDALASLGFMLESQ